MQAARHKNHPVTAGAVMAAVSFFAIGCASTSTKSTASDSTAVVTASAATPTPTPTSAASGGATSTQPTSATTTTASTASASATSAVAVADFAFKPASVTVKVGSTVVWTNGDSFAHSIHSNGGVFDEQRMNKGESAKVTFTKAGTFAYICGIHNSMTGTVVVES
jgi:plastocyanin